MVWRVGGAFERRPRAVRSTVRGTVQGTTREPSKMAVAPRDVYRLGAIRESRPRQYIVDPRGSEGPSERMSERVGETTTLYGPPPLCFSFKGYTFIREPPHIPRVVSGVEDTAASVGGGPFPRMETSCRQRHRFRERVQEWSSLGQLYSPKR